MPDHSYFANVIWQIADLLRGPYRPPQYERVMLPMTVLRRFDCVLVPTKAKVLAEYRRRRDRFDGDALDSMLNKVADQRFHNHSELDFEKLQGDPDNIAQHLVSYIQGFSSEVRRIFEYFEFEAEIEKMREANILYMMVSQFRSVDLHPQAVPNRQMGYVTCVPMVPLAVAAGAFGDPQTVPGEGEWEWVEVDTARRLRPGMFVAQVTGRSMEPMVPDGSYALFRSPVEGTRQGKTVLVELLDAVDLETGERHTLKRYESERVAVGDSWRHEKITLKPINPEFDPIVITGEDEADLTVVAELVEVLTARPNTNPAVRS